MKRSPKSLRGTEKPLVGWIQNDGANKTDDGGNSGGFSHPSTPQPATFKLKPLSLATGIC